MSLWVNKYRPTSLTKLNYHKELTAHFKKLEGYLFSRHYVCHKQQSEIWVWSGAHYPWFGEIRISKIVTTKNW